MTSHDPFAGYGGFTATVARTPWELFADRLRRLGATDAQLAWMGGLWDDSDEAQRDAAVAASDVELVESLADPRWADLLDDDSPPGAATAPGDEPPGGYEPATAGDAPAATEGPQTLDYVPAAAADVVAWLEEDVPALVRLDRAQAAARSEEARQPSKRRRVVLAAIAAIVDS